MACVFLFTLSLPHIIIFERGDLQSSVYAEQHVRFVNFLKFFFTIVLYQFAYERAVRSMGTVAMVDFKFLRAVSSVILNLNFNDSLTNSQSTFSRKQFP